MDRHPSVCDNNDRFAVELIEAIARELQVSGFRVQGVVF